MKKISMLMTVMAMIAMMATGCMGGEGYEDYLGAVDKTEAIQSGASQIEVVVESTFNEAILSELSADERKKLEQLKTYEFKLENHFNHKVDQSIYDIFYYNNNLGMDLKLYQRAEGEMFLKLPFMSAFYQVDDSFQTQGEPFDLEAFATGVNESWTAMLKSENIFVGEKTIVKNEDGEVKATLFSVKPTSAQLDIFMRQLRTEILDNKTVLLDAFNKLQSQNEGAALSDEDFDIIVNALFNSMVIQRYEETAYVDLDGYIIDEQIIIEIEYTSNDNLNNLFKHQTITIQTKKWDIEREQELDFSVLDSAEILPISELEEWSVNQ